MSTSPTRAPRRTDRTGLAVRVLGALALGLSAAMHLRIAVDRPPLYADGQLTISGLFAAQAVAGALVVVWVLVRGNRLAWLAFGAVALASLAALLLSVVVAIPSVGPFPAIYEPMWYPEKVLAAVSAGVAVLAAGVALAASRRAGR